MKKFFVLPILFCIIALSAAAQEVSVLIKYTTAPNLNDKSLIFYDAKRKLNWNDFVAAPNMNSIGAALTSAGLGYDEAYSYSDDKGELTITVYCDFDPHQSWVKPVGKNDYILKHEQHHFDISYINTLLFIKHLEEAKFTNANYRKTIRELYRDACKKMLDMQNQYDSETNNGLLRDKQAEWSDKIDLQLHQLYGDK